MTYDSRFAIFKIKPQQKLVRDLRRQKKKKEDLPKDSLGIYSFLSRKTEKIPEVRSYKIPEKAGGWVAYQIEARKDVKGKDEKPKADEKKTEEKKPRKKKANTDDNGYTLVLKKIPEGSITAFEGSSSPG